MKKLRIKKIIDGTEQESVINPEDLADGDVVDEEIEEDDDKPAEPEAKPTVEEETPEEYIKEQMVLMGHTIKNGTLIIAENVYKVVDHEVLVTIADVKACLSHGLWFKRE